MFLVNNLVGFGGKQLPASGSFSPSDISDLQLWFDSTTGVVDGGDGSVETWNDQSGNGDNATQTGASDKLTTGVNTQNSLNILDGDGSGGSDHMDLPSDIGMQGSTNRTIFFAGEPATSCIMFSQGNGTNGRFVFRNFQGGTSLRLEIQGAGYTSSLTATGFGIFGAMLNGTTLGDITLFTGASDESATGSTTLNTSSGSNAIGSNPSGNRPFTSVGEIIAYGKALTDSERNQVGNYLADRWALSWTDR